MKKNRNNNIGLSTTNPEYSVSETIEYFSKYLSEELPEKYVVKPIKESACEIACPVGTRVKAYVGYIANGNYKKALEVAKEHNPFPGICGRVCTHPCQTECRRGEIDESIAIRELKRFIADWDLRHNKERVKKLPITRRQRIAIIGAGPAGLTAAHDLVRYGYRTTVFEAHPTAGGMMTVCIPTYRLPRNIVEKEIQDIFDLGVEFRPNTKVGKDISIAELRRDYQAIVFAIGAHKNLTLNIPGEDEYSGVFDCIDFLYRTATGKLTGLEGDVIIVGGGNSAIDSARCALRLGAKSVTIIYRRSRKEMPADPQEVEDAIKEGVKIQFLTNPTRAIGKHGRITKVECIRMKLGKKDASGRARPIPIQGSEFEIPADIMIPAIGQKPELDYISKELVEELGVNISRWSLFEVDINSLATNVNGIFACGDVVSGPRTVIEAIASGHRVAFGVHNFLMGRKTVPHFELINRDKTGEITYEALPVEPEKIPRVHPKELKVSKRINSFNEVNLGFTEEQAKEEASRCLRCGFCKECDECISACQKRIMIIKQSYEEPLKERKYLRVPSTLMNQLQETEKIPENTKLIYSQVNQILCRGCGWCRDHCQYEAISLEQKSNGAFVARVDTTKCRGCGNCLIICPTGAMHQDYFSDKNIFNAIESFLNHEKVPSVKEG